MFNQRKFVLVFDCNGIMHMLKHGVKRDLTHSGYHTNIIFGFLGQLQYYAARFATSQFVFVWDSRKNLRTERYPWYKDKPFVEMSQEDRDFEEAAFYQFNQLRRYVVPILGFKNSLFLQGYEADDLIASVVMNNTQFRHIVISRDADMYQLLGYCLICNPSTKELITADTLLKQYNVTPEEWVDVKALGGCVSDRVPGIPGVKEKTAALWIRKALKRTSKRYQAIAADLANPDSIARRNDWLVRLPLPGTPTISVDFADEILSLNGYEDICSRYGFDSLLNEPMYTTWKTYFNLQEE
jgi:5'-3' exonuclease